MRKRTAEWALARPGRLIGIIAIAVIVVAADSPVPGTSAPGSPARGRPAQLSAAPVAVPSLPAPVPCGSCWRPPARASWQIQLSSVPSAPFPQVTVIESDGFDTPASAVAAMHRSTPGRGAVCYIDAGTWENWRPDAGKFPPGLLGRNDGNWAGERWLDIARIGGALGQIMHARAAMCKHKGFDAVDFDNVDGYSNDTGFHLTSGDQLRYDVFLASTAHRLGLSVALKNDLPQIPVLVRYFDFAVSEQCFQYHECLSSQNGAYGLDEFVHAHKAVFEIEYSLKPSQFCPAAARDHFNALRKHLNLGPWRQPCQ